jgi:hypothetical protein
MSLRSCRRSASTRLEESGSFTKVQQSKSSHTVRLCARHSWHLPGKRYGGKSGAIWAIQNQSVHELHGDAYYSDTQGLMLRQHLVAADEICIQVLFVSVNEKCNIATGQPGHLQTAFAQ